ncbi:MAG: glycosyltransferase [bacterium]|nr:glycosyltransferase [bacterium]
MSISVNFIERREGDSPSIERVFRAVATKLEALGIRSTFTKASFGNGIISTVLNLLAFRPEQADVIHITGHINYMGMVLSRDKTVLTIHDVTILDHRKGLRRALIERLYFRWPTRRLRYVTAISQQTKERLLGLPGLSDQNIRVIENPLLVSLSVPPRTKVFDAAKPTILQLGTAPNKNLERLIRAIAGIPCRLRIIGNLSPALIMLLEELNIDYTNAKSLSDADVELAYESADIVTLCSTDEGFGLPIIEAQAKGVVVVTSDRSPMKDVAAGGAYLVDPENVEAIRAGILAVIADSPLREDLVRRGRENVSRFDPARIADQYRSLYEEVVVNQII